MALLVSALVDLILGIIEKVMPRIVADIRAKQSDAKLAADEKKIADAIAKAQEPPK